MSFDYLDDTFGKYRKAGSKYDEVEDKAISLIKGIVANTISFDEIAKGFNEVRIRLLELSNKSIDQEFPLWLNLFLGNVFYKWHQWHILRKMHTEDPEKFNEPGMEEQYQRIVNMGYDDMFIDKCQYCLEELKNAQKI